MLSTGQTNAFSTELDGLLHLLRSIRIGADTERAQLVGPTHELHELLVRVRTLGSSLVLDQALDDLRGRRLDAALVNIPNKTVQGKLIAFLQGNAISRECFLRVIDRHAVRTTHTDLAHLTGH